MIRFCAAAAILEANKQPDLFDFKYLAQHFCPRKRILGSPSNLDMLVTQSV